MFVIIRQEGLSELCVVLDEEGSSSFCPGYHITLIGLSTVFHSMERKADIVWYLAQHDYLHHLHHVDHNDVLNDLKY